MTTAAIIEELVAKYRAYAASGDEGEPFATALGSAWNDLARLDATPGRPPWVVGAIEACRDLHRAWLIAEQVAWRSRVALIESGAHTFDRSVAALHAVATIPAKAYDLRDSHWDALVAAAPTPDDTRMILERVEPLIATGVLGTQIFRAGAERFAELGQVGEAVALSRRVKWPLERARALLHLTQYLEPAALAHEVALAWCHARTHPIGIDEHYRLGAFDHLLRVAPSQAHLVDLEAFIEALTPIEREECPDHPDAYAILADGWSRLGDEVRAAAHRARVPVYEPDPPSAPDPDAGDDPDDPDDPWELRNRVEKLPADDPALVTALDRALQGCAAARYIDRSAYRSVVAAIDARTDLPVDLAARARRELLARWELEDDLPPRCDREATAHLLRDALKRRRAKAWPSRRDRPADDVRADEIRERGGDVAVATWRVLDQLDEPDRVPPRP